MANLDEDSLFSLELVVDKLSIPRVTCRFPAIAFRLLDFPTLIVYHVEPDLGETIKSKITTASNYRVPPQLKELQDRDGNFQIKKGKSCLFKATPNLLQSLLSSTPLYVMLIDTYPETPRLMGNCTVPLDAQMDEVYEDICKLGVSVPSVHGEKVTYRLYDLMSGDIGNVTVGYRLLSLGMGLIPHIPDRSIAKLTAKSPKVHVSAVPKPGDKVKQNTSEEGLILEDLETADKAFQVAISTPVTKKQTVSSQTQNAALDTIATQTKTARSQVKKKRLRQNESQSQDSEYFITNTVCPPPLFYNSEAQEKSEDTMEFYSHIEDIQGYKTSAAQRPESEDEFSDDDTIRPEDKFSDSDIDEPDKSKLQADVLKKKSQAWNSNIAKSYGPYVSNFQQQGSFPLKQQPGVGTFPILNALMKEIVTLHGGNYPKQQQIATETKPSSPKQGSPRLRRALVAEKEHEETLARLATPRARKQEENVSTILSPGKKSHQVCAAGPTEVPKTKSWIRQAPSYHSYGVKKTKLAAGLTNTQRLRLAKTNPTLLMTLEKEEQERVEKWKSSRQKQKNMPQTDVYPRMGTQEIMTEVSRHPNVSKDFDPFESIDETQSRPPPLDLSQSGDLSHHHKKPVPTPRHSITKERMPVVTPRETKQKQMKKSGYGQKDKSSAMRIRTPSLEKVFLMPADDTNENSQSDVKSKVKAAPNDHKGARMDSERSHIEVCIPSASIHESDEDSSGSSIFDSDHGGQAWNNDFGKTKTLYSPGFPRGRRNGSKSDYSEDFESVPPTGRTAEPELRRIVETYSEESDQGQDSLFGNVPDLRMVVDKYSDHDDGSESHGSKVESFHSARSQYSDDKDKQQTPIQMINPPSSAVSPTTMSRAPTLASGTREPFAMSSTTVDESNISEDLVTGSHMKPVQGKHSSKKFERQPSVATESISSYAPSDEEVSPPRKVPVAGEYSDEFEDISDEIIPQPKYIKDLKVDPKAKMGYTWSGQ